MAVFLCFWLFASGTSPFAVCLLYLTLQKHQGDFRNVSPEFQRFSKAAKTAQVWRLPGQRLITHDGCDAAPWAIVLRLWTKKNALPVGKASSMTFYRAANNPRSGQPFVGG